MEWIRCDERLPENQEVVLVYDPRDDLIKVGTCNVDKQWIENYGSSCGCCGYFAIKPTHWMPYPDVPKQ